LLKHFEFDKQYETQLRELLIKKLEAHFIDQIENNKQTQARITELSNQLEKAEERYILGKITKEQYEKFSDKYARQRAKELKLLKT